MPENPSRPRSERHVAACGEPKVPDQVAEPRSFGADDIEGVRTGPGDRARRLADREPSSPGDRLPSGVSRASPG